MANIAPERVRVSIICVFNDPVVRQRCLDRSIHDRRDEVPEVEYLPIDNVDGAFASAGAAFNHAAARARHEVLVFVHQDVYLHSLVALEEAAGILLTDNGFGILGAFGPSADGTLTGYLRDRVVLLGRPVSRPTDVDSLDEVLFLTTRTLVENSPFTEHPDLAWHAYAVEYGLRMRAQGLRVGVTNIPLTHNSLTINLDRLDVAHRAVAAAHPSLLPVRTTCGVVANADPARRKPFLASQRWRYRWLKGSWAARSARHAAGGGPVVLADVRLDIDDVIAGLTEPFPVFNLDPSSVFHTGTSWADGLSLHRRTVPVQFYAGDREQCRQFVQQLDASTPGLLTNLDPAALRTLAAELAGRDHLLGLHPDFGCWVLLAPGRVTVPPQWLDRASVPLGMPAAVR